MPEQRFVVQYHIAERAGPHYDLRLQDGNSALSWALRYLPKGDERRLAIQVPNHKESWMGFEGTIDEGYGKGNVTIWDEGDYAVLYKDEKSYKLIFDGNKLVGDYWLRHWKDKNWLFWKE